jgi:hypothetical protein
MKCQDPGNHKHYPCPNRYGHSVTAEIDPGDAGPSLDCAIREAEVALDPERPTYCPVCDVCSGCGYTMQPPKDSRADPDIAEAARRGTMRRGRAMLPTQLQALAGDVAEWSNKTFGNEEARGPIGPLKHLVKEVIYELLGLDGEDVVDIMGRIELGIHRARQAHSMKLGARDEWADLLILVLDGHRRAMRPAPEHEGQAYRLADLLLDDAFEKMGRNRARVYPKPEAGSDEVSEHERPIRHRCLCGTEVNLTDGRPFRGGYVGLIPVHGQAGRRACRMSDLTVETDYAPGCGPTGTERYHRVVTLAATGTNETYTCQCGDGIVRFTRTTDADWADIKAAYFAQHGGPRN